MKLIVLIILVATLPTINSISNGTENLDHIIYDKNMMSIFTTVSTWEDPGPCRYIQGTTEQNSQCLKDYGLVHAIKEAKDITLTHCEQQFRYDHWNCSIVTHGTRNIFQKVYRETAFLHALTTAALTHSVARSCAKGGMKKCQCGTNRNTMEWQWNGCNDNLKHGKRLARKFLHPTNDDAVSEILRHDGEVGIQVVASTFKEKCKCYGVSGSCTIKTCWKKLGTFNETVAVLRKKYHHALHNDQRRSLENISCHKDRMTGTLLYLESTPSFCDTTRGRNCLDPENCATLCCGRGYSTRPKRIVEHKNCRVHYVTIVCQLQESYEDRFYCK